VEDRELRAGGSPSLQSLKRRARRKIRALLGGEAEFVAAQ
jgi:hypothetical protein